jgi:hypothetical protein
MAGPDPASPAEALDVITSALNAGFADRVESELGGKTPRSIPVRAQMIG